MTIIVAYGAGTNSGSILIGMHERGERPDAIVFADTGNPEGDHGEKPHTYAHIEEMQAWCARVGFPPITVLRATADSPFHYPQQRKDGSLYAECIRLGVLPAKAYGMGGCSLKWKVEPQDRWVKAWAAERGIALADIVRYVGFDADEHSRVERARSHEGKHPWRQGFPLYDWGWGREECEQAFDRAGVSRPGKSACFYCPSSKPPELRELRTVYPVLWAKALGMEAHALAGGGKAPAYRGKGLGRQYAWAELERFDAAQAAMFPPEIDCACVD